VTGDGWRGAVFSLLAPDAFRRHLAGAVLDRLAGGGLAVAGWREVLVTSRQIDAVAQIQRAGAGQAFRYRALDAIFALGPAVALRLADTAGRPADRLYREVKELKGASMPADTRPGSIRYDLGSVNAVLSLLHVSDSPENSARESRAILRGAPDGPAVDELFLPAGSLPGYLLARTAGLPAETRGHREVVAGLRGRVAARLWPGLSDAGRAALVRLATVGGLGEPAAGELLAAELAGPTAADPLADVLRATFQPGPAGPDADGPDPDELDLLLRRHRIGLDPWERVVLATSRYFAPAADRPAADRVAADRPAADRTVADRPAADRTVADRTVADRTVADRTVADRTAAVPGERSAAGA
jgi:nucleoside diphosphate kinase